MFRRRRQLTLAERVRGYAWPQGGWRRASKYVVYRVRRLPGAPSKIALGFACGAFISFTPLFGFHYLLSVATAWALRGSVIAAVFGANVGWFYPLTIVWSYHLGDWILGRQGTFLPHAVSARYLMHHAWTALLPTAIGSLPVALAVGSVSFVVVYWVVASYRELRHRRRLRPRLLRPAAAAKEVKP